MSRGSGARETIERLPLPSRADALVDRRLRNLDRTVHLPDPGLSRESVAPYDIRLGVSVLALGLVAAAGCDSRGVSPVPIVPATS